MKSTSRLNWLGGYAFEAELQDHKFIIDLAESEGGQDLGPRPKSLLLPALATCSAVGVIGILNKMRITGYKLDIDVDAETADTHPKVYTIINLSYNFTGENLDGNKLKKAVSVSEERYCSVYTMLSKTAAINSVITINGEKFI
ncbi:MAG: OsmC family protein [Candidatus Cloacimonetes bacterium]|nr:OsmC family protein [Candidatus Cloacimonadota bacterium]